MESSNDISNSVSTKKKPFLKRLLRPGVLFGLASFIALLVYIVMIIHNRSLRIFRPEDISSIAEILAVYMVTIIICASLVSSWLGGRASKRSFSKARRFGIVVVEQLFFAIVFFGGFLWIVISIDTSSIVDFSGGFLEPGYGTATNLPDATNPIRINWAPIMVAICFIVCASLIRSINRSTYVVRRILFEDDRLTVKEAGRLGWTYILIIVTYGVLLTVADGRVLTVTAFDETTGQIRFWYGIALEGLNGPVDLLDYFYYSFSTISTVGYGDIHPLSSFAKILSMSEAFIGTLSFALIVGSVMKGVTNKKKEPTSDSET